MTEQYVIALAQGDLNRRPHPVTVDAAFNAVSGLGEGDGARLIGFAELGRYELSVLTKDAVADPTLVVGLCPVFSDGSGFFNWGLAVEQLRIEQLPDPEPAEDEEPVIVPDPPEDAGFDEREFEPGVEIGPDDE